jgi:protein phosphatase
MPLFLDTGFSTKTGRVNAEDEPCLVVVVPNPVKEGAHGALLAVADGLVERSAPEAAARDAVRALNDSYYAAPEDWGLKHALQESCQAANQAVLDTGERGRAAALSALVMRRRRWVAAHAGHVRTWLLRDHELKLLTRDHITPRVGRAPQINRACGLGKQIEADFSSGEIQEGDIFVLTSHGVHDVLNSATIMSCLMNDISAQNMAEALTRKAEAAGRHGNLSACIARVEQVPPETEEDIEEGVAALPVVEPPSVGDTVDGFHTELLIHKSRTYRLYRALDEESGQTVALKFPNPRYGEDPAFPEHFLREEWIGKRVSSSHLVRILPLRKGRRTSLYTVMAFHKSENLAQRLRRKRALSLRETVFLGGQLLEALDQLHNQGVIHRDIRPKNVILDKNTRHLLLLGLGSSHITRLPPQETTSEIASADASFLAPELLEGGEPDVRTDIYAAGVTIYRMLTGKYPYGKITTADSPPRGAFVPPTRYKADTPPWLEEALKRACALDPLDRFESASDFAGILEDRFVPSALKPARAGARRWNWKYWEVTSIALLVMVLLVYLVLALR